MNENEQIPGFKSYDKITNFWQTHSLSDYWDQTEPAEFEFSTPLRHRYLVPIDRNILNRAQQITHTRGLSTESLVNLLLEQCLCDIEISVSNE